MRIRELMERPRAREMAGIGLTGLGVLFTLALATYSARDPSFFSSTAEPARNWIGPIGAAAAAALYASFGLAAWFLPAICFAAALRRLRHGGVNMRRGAAIGLALVGGATALLLALIVGEIDLGGAPLLAGGLLGAMVSEFLMSVLGEVGAGIISLILLMLGLALAARSSLAESTADAWRVSRRLASQVVPRRPGEFGEDGLARRRGKAVPAKEADASRKPTGAVTARPARRSWRDWLRPSALFFWRQDGRQQIAEPAPSAEPSAPPTPSKAPARSGRRAASRAVGRQARLPVDLPPASGAKLPPLGLLDVQRKVEPISRKELAATARAVVERFPQFKVTGKVDEFHPGPVVTTFEFQPDAGVKLSRITGLADDLALGLEAESVRMDRIPGRGAVGVEVPNRRRQTIGLREILDSRSFRDSRDLLTLGLGKTQEGEIYCTSLAGMPHLLVAGATGSGKSVGLNSMITSILYRAQPEQVRFILIDPKMLELGIYEGVPHLLVPVVTDMKLASNALRWAVREMERRYKILAACNVRHLNAYNRKVETSPEEVDKSLEVLSAQYEGSSNPPDGKKMPFLVIVVDELADMLITTGQEVEDSIARLAQKARAVGIHLILATQRPSVDVLTGAIKANFPARIAFRVASKIDSRTILDGSGAERLLGAGDMLYRPPGSSRLVRIHGAWISEKEGLRLVAWIKKQAKTEYDKSVLDDPPEAAGEQGSGPDYSEDPMYRTAVRLVIRTGHGSTSFLQRKLSLGYSRAARIVDQMEEDGILGPQDGSKPRKCLVGTEFLERMDQQDQE